MNCSLYSRISSTYNVCSLLHLEIHHRDHLLKKLSKLLQRTPERYRARPFSVPFQFFIKSSLKINISMTIFITFAARGILRRCRWRSRALIEPREFNAKRLKSFSAVNLIFIDFYLWRIIEANLFLDNNRHRAMPSAMMECE